jgi:hypothetical protein
MRKKRKALHREERVAILRRHLLDKVLVSEPYEELGAAANGILPLAKRVLRGRRCGLRVQGDLELSSFCAGI